MEPWPGGGGVTLSSEAREPGPRSSGDVLRSRWLSSPADCAQARPALLRQFSGGTSSPLGEGQGRKRLHSWGLAHTRHSVVTPQGQTHLPAVKRLGIWGEGRGNLTRFSLLPNGDAWAVMGSRSERREQFPSAWGPAIRPGLWLPNVAPQLLAGLGLACK